MLNKTKSIASIFIECFLKKLRLDAITNYNFNVNKLYLKIMTSVYKSVKAVIM